MTFGERLKYYREHRGFSQPELGGLLNPPVKGGTISSWEVGRTEPSLAVILELSQILRVNLDALICPIFTAPTTLTSSGHSQAKDELRDTMQYILDNIHDEAQLKQIKMFLETYKK